MIPYAEHMRGVRRVGEWARRAGVHRCNLRKAVLRATGMNPYDVLHRTHAERALALYRSGMTMEQAAYEAGYPDPFTFSHQCVRFFGARPRELRDGGTS